MNTNSVWKPHSRTIALFRKEHFFGLASMHLDLLIGNGVSDTLGLKKLGTLSSEINNDGVLTLLSPSVYFDLDCI